MHMQSRCMDNSSPATEVSTKANNQIACGKLQQPASESLLQKGVTSGGPVVSVGVALFSTLLPQAGISI